MCFKACTVTVPVNWFLPNHFKAGNGLGMKIVGGRTIPGTKTVGAYVAAIYQGGVAEQLLGELQEGAYYMIYLN